MNEKKHMFFVSPSPHFHDPEDTRSVMLDVIIALLPALCLGIYFFGLRTLTLCILSVTSCVVFEYLFQRITRQRSTVYDLSAIVTGILIVMCVPAHIPYWMVIVADFFAIVVAKQLFGGIGQNFMNPALVGRVFLFSWASWFSAYPATLTTSGAGKLPVFGDVAMINGAPDILSSATPLASLKEGILPMDFSMRDLFLGNVAGSIGEVSAFILLIGGLYLLLRGVISIRIPLCFIGTVALLNFVFPAGAGSRLSWAMYAILSGGLMLGAIFMATDYATSPVTPVGQIIYGVGCGLITYVIRRFGAYNEGVAFSILIMNTIVWSIDKLSAPRRFGGLRGGQRQPRPEEGEVSK